MYYEIVPMDRSHIPQIAALERACFSAPWTEAMLEEELFNPQASFIVAEDGEGSILGYAGLADDDIPDLAAALGRAWGT